MPKEKVTETLQGFITYQDYFATGEGRTVEINFCWAKNKDEAVERHLKQFGYKTKSAKDFWKAGLKCYYSNSKDVIDIFKNWFSQPRAMRDFLNEAGREMHFKLHFNYS